MHFYSGPGVSCTSVLLFCLFTSGTVRADIGPQFKSMPWHLIDLWWDMGKPQEFNSYSIVVDISDDVPDDVSLYISPVGLGHLNDIAFYGGIQTRTDAQTKIDPSLRVIGRGLLFSMWGERSYDAIRPSDGGFCQSSGHEGDFVSVRRAYQWTKGNFRMRFSNSVALPAG